MRLWIDTDIGDNPDDAVALLCASAHPDVDLVGVSTTGGRTEWRAGLARELVDVSVVPGERPDLVVETFRAAEPDALLAIGPLTTVAVLTVLGLAPAAVTVMGGALSPVRHRGREQAVEFNFGRAPSAARIVVAHTDATIVPLDVTVAMRLDDEQLDRLARADARILPELARWQAEFDDPVVLHDPLALLVCVGDRVGDSVVTSERRVVEVDARDGRLVESAAGREHAVVVDVDAPVAVDRVLGLLLRH